MKAESCVKALSGTGPAKLFHGCFLVGGLFRVTSRLSPGAHGESHGLQSKANLPFPSLCRQEEEVLSSDDEPLHAGDMLAVDAPAQKSQPTYKKSLRLSSEQIVCTLLLCCLLVCVEAR